MRAYIANLSRHRHEAGKTRGELAEISGVSLGTIHRIEAAGVGGDRTRVQARTLNALAEGLGVSAGTLAADEPLKGFLPVAALERSAAESAGEGAQSTYSGLRLELAGTAEVARLLGVSGQRVSQLRKNHSAFPEPVAVLEQGPVWAAEDIRSFAKTGRRAGRPHS